MNQTTEKLSFAEVYEEQKEKLGRSPSRVELFDACYTGSDGNPANKSVGTTLEHQSKLLLRSLDVVSPADLFANVRGKDPPGHVLMYGLGVSQSNVWGKLPSCGTRYRIFLEQSVAMSRMEEKMDEQSRKIAG
ncbi:hypothetical protein ACH5RR_018026 [Cinchona calisaya]|uniref:Uncharacterized protein n=1 Tax=Cinchona calisaya TaxID=153742 RepID=A0ABD2ZN65_9GENT